MLGWLAPSLVYSIAKDGWTRFKGQRHSPTAAERLALREKWNEPFAAEIHRCRAERLRQDVIIHDVRRLDAYPNIDENKGISPWFRAGLVGQYHKGIQVALSIHGIIYEDSESHWRLARADEEKLNSYLIGFIPYENILSVNFDGDEYYNYPHIFCYFSCRGQPYEKVAFCDKRSISTGHEYYTELDSVEHVKLTSQKFGTANELWTD